MLFLFHFFNLSLQFFHAFVVDVASKAALDSRWVRWSSINAASEKAFVLMSLLLFITRLWFFLPIKRQKRGLPTAAAVAASEKALPRKSLLKNVHGFLFVVGANPRVRPAALSCQTDFEQENNGFLPGRTHGCAPTHFFISSAEIAAAAMHLNAP